mgnify:CR=1 FL=1
MNFDLNKLAKRSFNDDGAAGTAFEELRLGKYSFL